MVNVKMEETFAERFSRLLFKDRRLSVEEVAATMKAGADAVRRIADGRTKQPRFDEMLRLCEAYGIDPYALAFGETTRRKSADAAVPLEALSHLRDTLLREMLEIVDRQEKSIRQVERRLRSLEKNASEQPAGQRKAG